MIFALPQYEATGEKLPATHWYYQVGNRWVAVDKEIEDGFGWFDEVEAWPEVREYTIDELPPSGQLVFVDVGGKRTEYVRAEPFVRFTNAVADLAKDGDPGPCRHCGHDPQAPESEVPCDHDYPRYERSVLSAWEILTGLIGEARTIRRALLEKE